MTLVTTCHVNVQTELPLVASLHPNPNGMDRWAEGKTNTLCHMYRSLYSCWIDTRSRICTRVLLRRLEVSHHDSDHLVEENCFSF
jgi:hypothetical protein